MSFNLLDYYKALNGESTETSSIWHINYDKRHAYKIFSDFDAVDEHNNKINLPPSEAETELINFFSDKLGQKLKNTKITDNLDGTESIDLELGDRIVTIIMDQSGSMLWNDSNNFRHDIVTDLIEKIEINYPGDITYNLVKYGADIIDVLFFGITENDAFDPNDVDSLSVMIKADDKANYDGMRIIRNDDHYPTSPLDGEIIDDGFISRIKDTGLVEGQTYYYTIYTYDKNFKFSIGTQIKVTPQERIVPRSHSNFKTVVESEDLTKGISMSGSGVNRDANTIGLWHMDEGEGNLLYDFSDTGAILEYNREIPKWIANKYTPAGTSGIYLNGDQVEYIDVDSVYAINFNTNNKFTFMGWIYPYDISGKQVLFGRSSSGEFNYSINISSSGNLSVEFTSEEIEADELVLESLKWQHVAVVYNDENPSGSQLTFYVNGISQNKHSVEATQSFSETHVVSIGNLNQTNLPYRGRLTEFSFHNIDRDSDYIQSQLVYTPTLDSNGNQVDTNINGIKDDNGDRLNVFKYDVPRDYNYVGGEVLCVRNEKNIPSWEEDGTVIYQQSDPGSGQFFISDPDDYVLGETYYYRLFTKNSLGNVSFLTDSPSLTVVIPPIVASDIVGADYRLALDTPIDSPVVPTIGQLITAGNKKTYLRWKQNDIIDSRIARVKIYYSNTGPPEISSDGGTISGLVFTGLPTDEKFVHRSPPNDKNAYYTIVNVDKYGRPCNYYNNGDPVVGEEFLYATVIPSFDASENTFPLIEVENINYELIDENTITIGWDQPQKSIENIDAFFDQTVYIYGAITDEFGDPVSEDTSIKMKIVSSITKETQADDVFDIIGTTEFEDVNAYEFFVTRTSDGFFKGILRMTSDSSIISQINRADFTIQLKALLPKEGGYKPPNRENNNPISEYASLIERLVKGEDSTETTSDNFYEYLSEPIEVSFTNPWEVELVSRDNQTVPERCYCEKAHPTTGELTLIPVKEFFNGIYMRATNPFVARAKVKYKGLPVESGNIQIAVWDADSSNLCRNACPPPDVAKSAPYEGLSIGDAPSAIVSPPDSILPIIQGEEDDGSGGTRDISFVDIPLYAPDLPQAVRLYVKGERSGYSSVQEMYVLFQNILQIDINSDAAKNKLTIDGKDIVEFRANASIINPDYPNDDSLVTYPEDLTVVEWKSQFVQTIAYSSNNSLILEFPEESGIGPIYSTDSVPITNGVYSYTRSGTARNAFMGPLSKGDKAINEQHEISSLISYQGLSASARLFFKIGLYNPDEYDSTSARFLMEVDGGWKGELPNQSYASGAWKQADSNLLWADGINYKKIKISRNPRTAIKGEGVDEFVYAGCFRECASGEDNELLELSSGQIVEVGFNLGNSLFPEEVLKDEEIEILHGEIYEMEDVYTGLHYLEVGEEGFIDNGSAFIELNAEDVSDVTYFYVRMNKFVPYADSFSLKPGCLFPEEKLVNECICLNPNEGIKDCDLPEWSPMMYVSGKTTVFLNNNPLVLQGGGSMETGIPPCPIGLNEPLRMVVKEMKVTNYFFSEELGNPSNDFLYPVETISDNNNFKDTKGVTLVKHTSDVDIRIRLFWRGQNAPNGTPVYVTTGDNTSSSLFISSQNVYYVTDSGEDYSYVDVRLNARRYIDETRSELIEIFSIYDESEKTERHVGETFFITLDKKDKDIDPPVLPGDDPSDTDPPEPPIITPYSPTMDRYNITTDTWSKVANMASARGNGFSGSTGDYIYYMGGLLDNNKGVSDRNEKYDVINNVWSDATKMPTPRFAGMSVTIGDDIYIIGGIAPNNQQAGNLTVTTLVEVYRADVDLWEELENMPILNEGDATQEELGVAFGTASHVYMNNRNYIYVMSGIRSLSDQSVSYNEMVFRYCVEDDEWEISGFLNDNELDTYTRISPLSIVYDNKVIVFGGAYLDILNSEEYSYNLEDFYIDIGELFETPSSGVWINNSGHMVYPLEPKFQSAMAEYDLNPSTDHAKYYIFGGANAISKNLNILESIDVKDGGFIYKSSYTITDPSIDITQMPKGKHGASAEFSDVLGSPYIYLMGGYTNNQDNDFNFNFKI